MPEPHDPLCPWQAYNLGTTCQCPLIEKVVDREWEKYLDFYAPQEYRRRMNQIVAALQDEQRKALTIRDDTAESDQGRLYVEGARHGFEKAVMIVRRIGRADG